MGVSSGNRQRFVFVGGMFRLADVLNNVNLTKQANQVLSWYGTSATPFSFSLVLFLSNLRVARTGACAYVTATNKGPRIHSLWLIL